ncbi:MAG: flavodoxin family protein [bacterium]
MAKRALAIMGSPRRGNTHVLLEETIRALREDGVEVERVEPARMKISPCRECSSCRETGVCINDDDMQAVYAWLLECDCLIIASPIFFMGLPAQMKALVDRCQALWSRTAYLRRPLFENGRPPRAGAVILVSGTKGEKLFDGALATVKSVFKILHVRYDEKNTLLLRGIDEKGDALKHDTAMGDAYGLGKRLAGILAGEKRRGGEHE